jgi:hypothetical protein
MQQKMQQDCGQRLVITVLYGMRPRGLERSKPRAKGEEAEGSKIEEPWAKGFK